MSSAVHISTTRLRREAGAKGQKVVAVIGGGFGGLNAAKTLSNKSDLFVMLFDQRNHHLFQPLLYQVATAGLSPGDIAMPIRSQFSDAENVAVHLGSVGKVNLKEKFFTSTDGAVEIEYDYLVLACGAQHSYFGHPEWEEFAPGLKTVEQATEIRRRILTAFELAENELDPVKQAALLTFVVVGAGPTGVELAGAIADISRTVLIDDFKRIDPSKAQVVLLEMGAKVLPAFSDDLGLHTRKDLAKLGVDVRTGAKVENINADGVQVGAEFLPAKSVFWAAGVQATKMEFEPAIEHDRAGRVKVTADLSVPGFKDTFVIGDMAAIEIEPGKIVPGLAPAAIQEGQYVANLILAAVRGKSAPKPFHYLDKGQMATIGHNRAVMESGPLKLTGYLAWLAWLFIHIFYLIGFKNRVTVMLQWIWSYLFSQRGARLITEPKWRLKR